MCQIAYLFLSLFSSRNVRHPPDVRLLPDVGAELGVPEEGHIGRGPALLVSSKEKISFFSREK